MAKISIVYNTTFYVVKFRLNLINRLVAAGHEVLVISPEDEYTKTLRDKGIQHRSIYMSQYGMNPVAEVISLFSTYKALKEFQPDVSLHYTIKPNTFGTIAARLAGTQIINNIAGVGKAFSNKDSLFAKFISRLYRFSLRYSSVVFFQNFDDMNLFLAKQIIPKEKAQRIPGSGVDLQAYQATPFKQPTKFRFLFIGRLLLEKGIVEYLQAAANIINLNQYTNGVEFFAVGEHEDRAEFIDSKKLEEYCSLNQIHYLGTVSPEKMPKIIAAADCAVLPSYYGEGVPRSLLEAAALGKPMITTDNVGCREVVEDEINGYQIPIQDTPALEAAIKKMLSLDSQALEKMGKRSRQKVEQEFSEELVISAYLNNIDLLTQNEVNAT